MALIFETLVRWKYECLPEDTCGAFGDPHIYTFDGARVEVFGVAQYLFSEYISDGCFPSYKVLMNTQPVRHVSKIDEMFFMFETRDGSKVEIMSETSGQLSIYYPNTTWKAINPQENEDWKYIRRGKRVYFYTWSGLWFERKGSSFKLSVPGYYNTLPIGLCQDKNNDLNNDYKLRNGEVLPVPPQDNKYTEEEIAVGKSWIEGSAELMGCIEQEENPDDEDPGTPDPGPDDPEDVDDEFENCDSNHTMDEVALKCEETITKSSFLQKCIEKIDVTNVLEACKLDLCMEYTNETLFDIIEHIVDNCEKHVDEDDDLCSWKNQTELQYNECGEGQTLIVTNSCNPSNNNNNHVGKNCDASDSDSSTDQCVCDDGKFMHNGGCVENCPIGGDWTDWAEWSFCTTTCGGGSQVNSFFSDRWYYFSRCAEVLNTSCLLDLSI